MLHFEKLINTPTAFDARQREAMLENAQHIAQQAAHPLQEKAALVVKSLSAAEHILPPEQDLIRIGKIQWDRKTARKKRFRGFADQQLVATIVRLTPKQFHIELPARTMTETYTSFTAARLAAAQAVFSEIRAA
ncbi:hypothetical protein HAT86_15035 [Roseovarius gahaiensis]|uniref:Uncharacterized protein n=1 Tax=Roseovarius gahaiensis TaxID=2716691 RepID=A0A967EH42_9RHOB|nr:hypothetical protein [Roseovarius gahaiensis]NHQ75766.1 hypothetical protein [Roseovarius gahaiensis]